MNKHCKVKCSNIGICHTCGFLQDGHKTECGLPGVTEETEVENMLNKALFVGLLVAIIFTFGKAFGQW